MHIVLADILTGHHVSCPFHFFSPVLSHTHISSGSRIHSPAGIEKDTTNSRDSGTPSPHVAFQKSFHEVPHEGVPWARPSLLVQSRYHYPQSRPNAHPSNTAPPPYPPDADAPDAYGCAGSVGFADYKLQSPQPIPKHDATPHGLPPR